MKIRFKTKEKAIKKRRKRERKGEVEGRERDGRRMYQSSLTL